MTLSAGVAFSVTTGAEKGIYDAADEALYEAKRRGRVQFAFFERSQLG